MTSTDPEYPGLRNNFTYPIICEKILSSCLALKLFDTIQRATLHSQVELLFKTCLDALRISRRVVILK